MRRARHLGLDVFKGDLEEAGFDPGSFDAVFMIDVLELPIQSRTLATVSQVLRPGGVLCRHAKCRLGRGVEVLGRRWWGMLPGHVVLFPHRRLCELLRSLGFGVRSQRPGRCGFLDYWLASAGEYLPGVTLVRRGLRMAGLDRLTVPVNLLDERVVVATKLESERAEAAPSGLVMPIQTAPGHLPGGRRAVAQGLRGLDPAGTPAAWWSGCGGRRLTGRTVPRTERQSRVARPARRACCDHRA